MGTWPFLENSWLCEYVCYHPERGEAPIGLDPARRKVVCSVCYVCMVEKSTQ